MRKHIKIGLYSFLLSYCFLIGLNQSIYKHRCWFSFGIKSKCSKSFNNNFCQTRGFFNG